ncbi:Forkhead-associated (FHA) domain-containing protein [Cynara cardunculus var. scolymus]|uniref:Forkhead-associated (FHA) domain-containing protein n=1 Tax=Cynara cardunculus var. scolymus TaxID=59895 RepID=A0A103XJA5_CYNCS|nr:Forkhead-associated (FHA) domain-containing protein [Cynara cardunculus var. scolymus]
METLITSHSVSCLNLKNPLISSQFPQSFFHLRPNFPPFQPSAKLQFCVNDELRSISHKRFGASIRASMATDQITATDDGIRWLLEPVGDGDSRHIGFKVAMPSAFEIASSVLCCYVVSGTHARLQKKGGDLLVTDLGSTNGTFIDEKRLTPGVPSVIPPGRYVTFGPIFIPLSTTTSIYCSLGSFEKESDTNLAIFRVSKVKIVKSNDREPTVELETEGASSIVENTSQNV